MTARCTIILAAGQGTRMKSTLPKVLHPLAGVPMITWAVDAALSAGTEQVVLVVGHGREKVMESVRQRFGERVDFAVQHEQRGTADAVRAGVGAVRDDVTEVMITYGDVPSVPPEALRRLAAARGDGLLSLLTTEVDDPTGYGRILRDAEGRVVGIREHKDCSDAERAIRSVNPGLYCVTRAFLERGLAGISSENAQGEFYLTDLVAIAAQEGAVAEVPWAAAVLQGVNDRAELATAEEILRKRIADAHRRAGSTVASSAVIDRDVEVSPGAFIGPNVVLRGRTRIGPNAVVDVGSVLDNAVIEQDATVRPYSIISNSQVGPEASVGPFAHLRVDSHVGHKASIGNFVELKKTEVRAGAKAQHLAYLGDGDIGPGANIGAGTIFCNYDGVRKHQTTIGEGAFVGSNSSLVAPVTIGKGSYVGSGSVITRDVPEDALAVGRARQEIKPGYASRIRERLKSRG
ncbi:MAG: bifunctional UDP-N-acetylglucosamine diphosphorylase/glucosamine-1-phosphate N-acetyltransferase GlmU [Polyangiales bacterium]